MSDLHYMSIADAGRLIRDGDLSPVDLVEALLTRISQIDPKLDAFLAVTGEQARADAQEAQEEIANGNYCGPMHGIPYGLKDIIDHAGLKTTAHSKLLAENIANTDATVTAKLKAAGGVFMGKLATHEFAIGGPSFDLPWPPARNPWNTDRHPGGSSSGSGAAVAAGLLPGALGSDTGGSVRIPAAWNDLVGLKTTAGRVSIQGVVPLCATFDTVGPLSKTVEDAALLFAALEGRSPADLTASSLRGKRLGILQTVAFDELREAPAIGFETALAKVIKAGAIVEDIEIKAVAKAMPLSPILFAAEAYGTWKTVIEAQPEVMFEEILNRFRGGADFAACDYIAASQMLAALRQDYLALTAGYDAILCPTAPILPPNAARLMEDADYYVKENLLALRNTRIGNLMGLCAITLPSGTPSSGLMLMGRPGAEEGLLRLAQAAEAAILA